MTRNHTELDLQVLLDHEFSWRLQEISEIKTSVKGSSGNRSKMLTRAGVALLYAHWEGFVKQSSTLYLDFVTNQRLKYVELKPCFVVFGFKAQLHQLVESKNHRLNVAALTTILEASPKRAKLSYVGAINAEDNLKSKVFENMAYSLGIDTTPYETKYKLIDESLLKRRNQIAHGEGLDLDPKDYVELSDEVTALMRNYKNDLENAATLKSYKL